jgi:hypothetical protein
LGRTVASWPGRTSFVSESADRTRGSAVLGENAPDGGSQDRYP